MKRFVCVVLALMLLLSFAACKKEEKAKEKTDRECIEELLVAHRKSLLGVATKEEYRSVWSEAFWESMESMDRPFAQQYENSLTNLDESGKPMPEVLIDRFGENYTITAEVTELEPQKDTEALEESFDKAYHYTVDIDKAYKVKATIVFAGDKDTLELTDQEYWVFLIDGRWCLK